MKAGYVPLQRISPLIATMVAERWPDGNGFMVLADKAACDESAIRYICDGRNENADFDFIDKLFCALGRPDLWWGQLNDIYQAVEFQHTCELHSCGKRFPEKFNGPVRKKYCSPRCATLANAVRRGEATGERLRQKGKCLKGHAMTPENTIIKTRKGRKERQCRECKRASQREWMRRKREDESFRQRAAEAQRRWRAKQEAA